MMNLHQLSSVAGAWVFACLAACGDEALAPGAHVFAIGPTKISVDVPVKVQKPGKLTVAQPKAEGISLSSATLGRVDIVVGAFTHVVDPSHTKSEIPDGVAYEGSARNADGSGVSYTYASHRTLAGLPITCSAMYATAAQIELVRPLCLSVKRAH